MLRSALVLTSALVSLAAADPARGALVVDFDEASDLSGFDSVTSYSHTATGGVGGSGGVAVAGDGAVAQYTAETFSLLSAGDRVTMSMDGLFDDDVVPALTATPGIRLGLTPETTTGFGDPNYLQGSLIGGGIGDRRLQVQAGGASAVNSNLALVDDTWYRLVVDFLAVGSNQVQITASLFSLGAAGDSTPVAVGSPLSQTFTQAAIRGDGTLYTAFKTNSNSGVKTLDNLTVVIPEPASLALMVLGGLCVARRARS